MSATPASLLAALCACVAVSAGCGGEDDSSAQRDVLRDDSFRNAVRAIGVSPAIRPEPRLGRAIGARMRVLTTDEGRLAPGSFTPGAYRRALERRGRLTRAQFRRRHGQGPLEMCDRLGVLTGQLDARLDEDAELARAVRAGYGRRGTVRDELNGLLPSAETLDCATKFRSSYVFVRRLYDED